jgi:tetratricopeptide (TPR) repeat protein/DNA-binding transcriptional ArsR family regulator
MQHSLVSVFTPSLMSAEDLEHIFVQREPLAQDLIRRIVDSTKGRGKEHSLLIGMRGMGKTHLVSLVYHRVKALPELNDKLLIAWLREEEWGVDSWLDLVMRIFRAIAEDRGSADSGMAKDLLDRFHQEGFERAKGSATKFLRDLIGKRTLLLIIENMDDLFQGLGEQGQQEFRAFLQEHRCCTVLATTPAMFRGVESREMPFYGFFHPCYLESIEVDEAVKMLGQIASLTTVRDDHHDLAVFLQSAQGRARVRAVHHLAGGNPRVYTLFAQFMTRESLDDLVDAFMKMLDDLTPYYQARMKELSNQQRKIVELLVDRRQAVMVKDIAETCFIDQRAVASQLRELKKKGYVVSNEVGRESFYELREVLMRFCMEVKKFRGRWVELILDFLKIWYRPNQRSGLFKKFNDSKFVSIKDWVQLISTNDDPVVDICSGEFIKALKGREQLIALKLVEELKSISSIKDKDYQTITGLIRNGDFKEAQFAQALAFCSDNKKMTCLKLLDDLLDSDSSFYKASYVKGIISSDERNWIESINFFDKTIAINPEYSEAWYRRGVALCRMGNHEDAVISYDNYIAINPTNFEVWASRANCQCTLGKYEESLASCDKALAIKTALHETWNTQGHALYNLGRYEESIISWGQAIAIKPDEPEYPHNMGIYYFKLGKYSESIDFFQQAISVQLDRYDFWHDKGLVQFVTSDYQAALVSWQQAFNYISNSAVPRYYEDISGMIQEFIEELIPRFTQPSIQETLLIPLLAIYKESNVITELGATLVNTLHLIVAPTISDHTAAEWLSLWRTSSLGNEPAMELPLRLMSTAIEYKKDPSKRQRLWLNLPSEERPILDKALKIQ